MMSLDVTASTQFKIGGINSYTKYRINIFNDKGTMLGEQNLTSRIPGHQKSSVQIASSLWFDEQYFYLTSLMVLWVSKICFRQLHLYKEEITQVVAILLRAKNLTPTLMPVSGADPEFWEKQSEKFFDEFIFTMWHFIKEFFSYCRFQYFLNLNFLVIDMFNAYVL